MGVGVNQCLSNKSDFNADNISQFLINKKQERLSRISESVHKTTTKISFVSFVSVRTTSTGRIFVKFYTSGSY
jgi:hypothetical protein